MAPILKPFSLPRLNAGLASQLFGFLRESNIQLGFYEPGDAPVVYDPAWTRPRVPEAVVAHERTHQNLTINTHHGLLTQLLAGLADEVMPKSFRACLEEQWSVQEAAAIHTELSIIQQRLPEAFDQTVAELPIGALDQPPYRELFDAVSGVLPLDGVLTEDECACRALLVYTVAGCSLQTRCLLELATRDVDDDALEKRLRDESPHVRFERLIAAIGGERLGALARGAAARIAEDSDRQVTYATVVATYITEIQKLVPDFCMETPETLQGQARAAAAALETRHSGEWRLTESGQGRTPRFEDSPEKRRLLEEYLPDAVMTRSDLDTWLARCDEAGGDVHFILGIDQGLDRIPDDVWAAAVCMGSKSTVGAPDDLRGKIALADLIAAIRPYPQCPRAVTSIADAWMPLYATLNGYPGDSWVHPRMGSALMMCVYRTLSRELLPRLLEFEDISRDARVFVMEINSHTFAGCFVSPSNPTACAIQKIPSAAALRVFEDLVEELGILQLDDPRSYPYIDLLQSTLAREMNDSPGFAQKYGRS